MRKCRGRSLAPLSSAVALIATPILFGPAQAFDINDQFAFNGLLAGAFQCQQVSGLEDDQDVCRGAVPFQPEILYTPTEQDQFFVKFGFAAGNGLNDKSPFVLTPWAADLEDDVKDINGSDRSYLLEVWYAHRFDLAQDNSLEITGGIIDPAFYVNENAYANDEFTQFMNEAFVNDHSVFLPAYEPGGVLVWKINNWTFSGVGMNGGETDEGRSYNWYGLEADYHLETPLGEGNYRVMASGTSNDFLDPSGERTERREGWSLSFDQELGKVFGAFLRMGWQGEDAAVTYKAFYTGGLDIKGSPWGRELDNIGIGYGYLDGGNTDIARTNVFETYYRFVVNDYLAITADAQYMEDAYHGGEQVDGWVLGMRAVTEF